MRKIVEKKEKAPPEKFFGEMVKVFYTFHIGHFMDSDGYKLAPDFNEQKRGMEYSGLKKITTRLRELAESKEIEWSEEYAKASLWNFLLKAYHNFAFIKRGFLLCVMAKYRDPIIASQLNFVLSKKIIELWYSTFPDKRNQDQERDLKGAEIIIGYIKQQYLQNNITFNDESVMQTVRTIFYHIKKDDFWAKKSLVSVGYNIPEFVIKIKLENKNGTNSHQSGNSVGGKQSSSDERISAIGNFTIKTRDSIRRGDSERDETESGKP